MPIRVQDLAPCNTKAKNVATEDYVDDHVDNIESSIAAVENAVINSRDNLAEQLGYSNYGELLRAASQGNTIINGGYIQTSLIDASALTVNSVSVNEGATGAHLAINNDVIKVFDANGTLRVKLGDLNA